MEAYLQDFNKEKLAVYIVIVGNYDTLKDPKFVDDNCDYICFTDNEEFWSDTWQICHMREEGEWLDKIRKQRMYKVLPHKFLPEYKYSVYIDGNVRVIGSLRKFVTSTWGDIRCLRLGIRTGTMPMMRLRHA